MLEIELNVNSGSRGRTNFCNFNFNFNNESYKRQMTDNYLSQFVFVLKIAFFDILNFKLNYMSRVKNDACIYYKFLLKFPVDTYIGER